MIRKPVPVLRAKLSASCAADGPAVQTAARWVDLALGCGYYDQSHFINEFRAFSGLSPVEFLQKTRHE